jgi:hypothetical protein
MLIGSSLVGASAPKQHVCKAGETPQGSSARASPRDSGGVLSAGRVSCEKAHTQARRFSEACADISSIKFAPMRRQRASRYLASGSSKSLVRALGCGNGRDQR